MFAGVLEHLRTSNAWLELQAALQPISSGRRAANGCRLAMITTVYPPGAAVQRLSGSHLQTKCFNADISSPLLHVRFLSAYSSVALLCSITDSLLSRLFFHDSLRSALCRTAGKTDASDCRGGPHEWPIPWAVAQRPAWPLNSNLHIEIATRWTDGRTERERVKCIYTYTYIHTYIM